MVYVICQGAKVDRLNYIIDRALAGIVTADQLAKELNCHPRSIYRYVGQLRKAGVKIIGEAGAGYLIVKKGAKNGQGNGHQVDGQHLQQLVWLHEGRGRCCVPGLLR